MAITEISVGQVVNVFAASVPLSAQVHFLHLLDTFGVATAWRTSHIIPHSHRPCPKVWMTSDPWLPTRYHQNRWRIIPYMLHVFRKNTTCLCQQLLLLKLHLKYVRRINRAVHRPLRCIHWMHILLKTPMYIMKTTLYAWGHISCFLCKRDSNIMIKHSSLHKVVWADVKIFYSLWVSIYKFQVCYPNKTSFENELFVTVQGLFSFKELQHECS